MALLEYIYNGRPRAGSLPTASSEISMFGNLGFAELCIIAVVIAVFIWPAWRICRKAGYPGVLALAFFVPLLNIALVLFLAFAEWPIERQVRALEDGSRSSFAR
jgi:hypothetical protein